MKIKHSYWTITWDEPYGEIPVMGLESSGLSYQEMKDFKSLLKELLVVDQSSVKAVRRWL